MTESDFDKLSLVLKMAGEKNKHEASKLLATIDRENLSDKSKSIFDKASLILGSTKTKTKGGLVYCILAMEHETDVLKMTVSPLIQQLSGQDAIFILFNGFKNHALKTHFEKHTKIHVWESEGNLGVAGGRNLLYAEAIRDQRGFDYVITLDNDVIVPNDFNEKIINELRNKYNANNIGILGGFILDFKKQKVKKYVTDNFLSFPGYLSAPNYNIFSDDISSFIKQNVKKLDTILWHIGIDKRYNDAYIERTDLLQSFRGEKQTYFPFLAHAPDNEALVTSKFFEVSNVPGCFQAISVDNLKEAGMLDERFSPYFFEDSEYSIRLMKLGKRNFICGEIVLFHGTDERHLERKKISSKFEFLSNEYRARLLLLDKLGVKDGLRKLVKQSIMRCVTTGDNFKAYPEFIAALVGIRRGMMQLGIVDKIGEQKGAIGKNYHSKGFKEFIARRSSEEQVDTTISLNPSLPPPDKGLPQVYFSQLKKFRNIYEGQDCLIVCNGPSLKKTHLGLFAGMPTFCVNSTFILQEQLDFKPDFFTVEDNHVIDDNLANIKRFRSGVKFFPDKYREKFGDVEGTHYVKTIWDCYWKSKISHEYPEFSEDAARGVYTGQTVTYLNLQLAYYMGFKRVFIVGLDFSYSIPKGSKIDNNSIDHDDDDPNHFHASYFGKGRQWHFPKLDSCMVSYSIAKEKFARQGREVIDLTLDGCLNVFRRSSIEQELNITQRPKKVGNGLSFKQYLVDVLFAKYSMHIRQNLSYLVNEDTSFIPSKAEHVHLWFYERDESFVDNLFNAIDSSENEDLVAYLHEKTLVTSNCATWNELPFCSWLSSQVNTKCAELTEWNQSNVKILSKDGTLYLPNSYTGRKTLRSFIATYQWTEKVIVFVQADKILIKHLY